jgi:hypothetical protein
LLLVNAEEAVFAIFRIMITKVVRIVGRVSTGKIELPDTLLPMKEVTILLRVVDLMKLVQILQMAVVEWEHLASLCMIATLMDMVKFLWMNSLEKGKIELPDILLPMRAGTILLRGADLMKFVQILQKAGVEWEHLASLCMITTRMDMAKFLWMNSLEKEKLTEGTEIILLSRVAGMCLIALVILLANFLLMEIVEMVNFVSFLTIGKHVGALIED